MRLRTLLIPFATTALLTGAGPAHAAFFKAEAIDSGAGIKSVKDLDVARDSTGAVAYVKTVGLVDHVFVSRMVNGVFQSPEQVDAGLTAAGSVPVAAASDGGRVAVAYISGGALYAAVRPNATSGFTAPQQLSGQASDPSIDMSINGVAYISFTENGSSANVRAARLDAGASSFNVLPDALDINVPEDAGVGGGRSDIAVSADGTAVVVFGESGRVFGRRVFEGRISTAPQDLTVDALEGHAGNTGSATDPHIDIEDDSSFAWVSFRQSFDDNLPHTVTRRLVGSAFEPAVLTDGLGFGGDQSATVSIEMNGRGEGLATTGSAAQSAQVAVLHDDKLFPATRINQANNVPPRPRGDLAENNDGYVAWMQGATAATATVQAAFYDVVLDKRTVPGPTVQTEISSTDFGPVDISGGLDVAVDRVGDMVAVFVQGTGDGRRLVYGGFDRQPGVFTTSTTPRFRNIRKPQLAWSTSFDLWSPLTYEVQVDGVVVGQTTGATRLPLKTPLVDGVHPWKVTVSDRRGQKRDTTNVGQIRVDTTPPALSFRVDGVRSTGRTQTVRVTTTDPKAPAGTSGSGVARVVVDFGDGSRRQTSRKAQHAYRKGGTYTVRVSSTDAAGNATVVRKSVTVKTPKKTKKKKK
ncbi:hypothetical protein DSM112329_02138 [Paraconexibacter sp. AEG42_29]|uniref:PKD domain-containing protein n=1 Tax=Paraconexibacter sp. AEG42_29 TaxID=2997339 RepID=A0AAU7AVA5_9ACTN